MPRTCLCTRLLQRAGADPALRALPPTARLVLFEMIAWATTGGSTPGHIRFLHPVPRSVSGLLNLSETEVEAALADLAALGVVEMEPDGKGLWFAEARKGAARAETARINGLKGGRPRADGSPARSAVRQGALLLPVSGGRPETHGTEQPEPAAPPPHHDDDSISLRNSPDHHPRATASDAVALAGQLAALAGMDPARSSWDARTVQGWLNAGADAALCRDVVADVMARAKSPPANFRYFDRAVRQALSARAAARQDRDRPLAADVQAILDWANGDRLGPMPMPARPASAA